MATVIFTWTYLPYNIQRSSELQARVKGSQYLARPDINFLMWNAEDFDSIAFIALLDEYEWPIGTIAQILVWGEKWGVRVIDYMR